MNISITVTGDNTEMQLAHLKEYIETTNPDLFTDIEVLTTHPEKGEMGIGILGSLGATIIGVANPIARFFDFFSDYTSSFRTELILKNEYGDELVLNTKKINEEGIHLLIDKFLQKKGELSADKTVK